SCEIGHTELPQSQREDDSDDLGGFRQGSRFGLLQKNPARRDALVVPGAALLFFELQTERSRDREGILGSLAGEIRNGDGTTHDGSPKTEPHRSCEDGQEEHSIKKPKKKSRHDGKLTRDGTLRTGAAGPRVRPGGLRSVLENRIRRRNSRLVRRQAVPEGGPALPLGVFDLQVLPDREYPRFLQPARRSVPAGEGTRHGLRDHHRSRLDRRLPGPPEPPPRSRRLLHLRGSRDLVPGDAAADSRQRLRHRRKAARGDPEAAPEYLRPPRLHPRR